MNDIHFNKNDDFEDISSHSSNYRDDDFEDISSDSKRDPRRRQNTSSRNINRQGQSHNGQSRQVRQGSATRQTANGRPGRRPSQAKQDPRKKNSRNMMPGEEPPIKKKKKKNPFIRAFTAVLLVIIIIIGIGAAIGYSMIGKMKYTPSSEGKHVNQFISDSELYSSDDVTNILLLGVDAREGESVSRSDTMMLISIDRANKKIKLTSFLRDSYVEIPGSGFNKLNAACTKGGVELVMDTIEYNYKINIDNYMLVDFKAFEELIDAIGGVDVEVTDKEAKYLNDTWYKWSLTGNQLTFNAGENSHLNGEEALMFCRIRKLDSDVYRTERQRRVISSVKSKIMSSPFQIFDIANTVLPLVQTDIPQGDMMKLAVGAVFSYIKYDMAQMSIPAEGTWHSESKSCGDSLVFDIPKNASILKDFIYFDVYEGKEETAEITTK